MLPPFTFWVSLQSAAIVMQTRPMMQADGESSVPGLSNSTG